VVYVIAVGSVVALGPFLLWPGLAARLFGSNDYLPHVFCYLRRPGLVWTHVTADSLIGVAYLAISVTLAYLVYKARRDIPFHWIFLAFGLFIIACGGTHFMEVVTIWKPVYVLSAAVKIFTALASLMTAVVLPLNVPTILTLGAKGESIRASDRHTARQRGTKRSSAAGSSSPSEICSLFYLQSTHTTDQETVRIFRDMENRVHSMALVHESLYGSENLARIDFAEYAQALAKDILSSHESPSVPVQLISELEPIIMSADLAVPCGLILNELISNAFKHGFPNDVGGEIRLTLRRGLEGQCSLCVEDSGVGIPASLDINTSKSLGLRLVRSLTMQIRGSFELVKIDPGTSARLQFKVNHYAG